MKTPRKDPLLGFTRLALWITLVIAAIVAIGLAVLIPGIWLFDETILAKAALNGVKLTQPDSLAAVSAIMFGGLLIVLLAIQFLRKLIALIDSVGKGSPFIPENAARLRYMGWIVLTMQAMGILAVPALIWIRQALPEHHIVFSMSFDGLIAALLLFILARVFDHGTQLEEDVEGTV